MADADGDYGRWCGSRPSPHRNPHHRLRRQQPKNGRLRSTTIAKDTPHAGPSFFGSLWHAAGADIGRAASSLENWSEKNWGTVAGFGHGLASVPGLVGREWVEASKLNATLASKTEHLAADWTKTAASARGSAIADIDATAHGASVAAEHAVSLMRDANRVPLFIERNASHIAQVDRSVVGAASAAKAAASDSIERAPQLLRTPLHWLAGKSRTDNRAAIRQRQKYGEAIRHG